MNEPSSRDSSRETTTTSTSTGCQAKRAAPSPQCQIIPENWELGRSGDVIGFRRVPDDQPERAGFSFNE